MVYKLICWGIIAGMGCLLLAMIGDAVRVAKGGQSAFGGCVDDDDAEAPETVERHHVEYVEQP